MAPGWQSKLQVAISRMARPSFSAKMHEKQAAPGTDRNA